MNAKLKKALLLFLFWARRTHGYAGGAKGRKLLMGGEEFVCSRGKFTYFDTFRGPKSFIGQELVWSGDDGWIWGMNYYGVALAGEKDLPTERIYQFLRSSLLSCDAAAPYRGPKSYAQGKWVYENNWAPWSRITRFSGEEKIFYNGRMVYEGEYHGVALKDK